MNISELEFKYEIAEPNALRPNLNDVCVLAYARGVWLGVLKMAHYATCSLVKIDAREWVIMEGFDLQQHLDRNVSDIAIYIQEAGQRLNPKNWLHIALRELPEFQGAPS